MVALTISLLIIAALVAVFSNSSRSTRELSKVNTLIDSGRLALQVLQDDIMHAGYWGGYVPAFDNLKASGVPGDVPTGVPDPCKDYTAWTTADVNNFIGIALQSDDSLPAGAGCTLLINKRAGTDVLVIRRAEVCLPGAANCNADVAGALNFQPSQCAAEETAGFFQTAAAAGSSTATLSTGASSTNGMYVGLMLHTTGGLGAGQYRRITAYDGATKQVTVDTPWDFAVNATTSFAFPFMLGTSNYPLHNRNCTGTGTPGQLPITAGTIADKRKFISHIYYIRNDPNPDFPTQNVPTLVRAQFDVAAGVQAHQAPEPLIEGVEAFRVELGIDALSKSGAAVDYTQAIVWANPNSLQTPTNRGNGIPEGQFVRCTGGACTAAQLTNVVAAKIYLLMRDRDTTLGYTDTKTYCLGEPNTDGTCPMGSQYTPNDNYKRHMFVTSARVINVAGRRETPP